MQQKPSPFVRNGKLRSSRDDLDGPPFERNSSLRRSRDDDLSSAFQRFGGNSSRRSLASNNALKWAEAQEKIENKVRKDDSWTGLKRKMFCFQVSCQSTEIHYDWIVHICMCKVGGDIKCLNNIQMHFGDSAFSLFQFVCLFVYITTGSEKICWWS